MNALDVRNVGAKAEIGEPAILANGLKLEIGDEIGKRVAAGIVIVLILPHEAAKG